MDFADFYELARRRRSTRLFQDRAVDAESVRRIIAAAVEAPTACNRQLWHFVAVTDPAVKVRLSRESRAEQSYLYDAPVLIAVFYDCTLETRNPCHTPHVTAGMAIYAMLLAAEAQGLGAIYLGGIRRPAGVARALGAPPFLTNLGIVCVGHRAYTPPAPPHRSVEEVLSYDRCGLRQKRFHADIRPHLWKLEQLADFRDRLTWYKGVHVDGQTLHVDPDPRFSEKFQYMTERIGMLLARWPRPRILDTFSLNGDLAIQILNSAGGQLETLYAYELTRGLLDYLALRVRELTLADNMTPLLNASPDELRIPLPDQHVELITCYERLEHFQDPMPMLREWHRVLKPGGRAFVVVSNRFYPHLYRYRRMRRKDYALGRNWNRGPERKYEPAEIQRCFRATGLAVEARTGLQPVELKAIHVASALAARARRYRLAGRLADRARQRYTTRSFTTLLSSSIAYELVRS